MKIKTFGIKDMTILPPRPGVCQICGTKHDPELPHNKDSLYYQYKFYQKHGRWPTWDDAMAHCTDRMKRMWKEEMADVLGRAKEKTADAGTSTISK